jgi:hypothetical protein
MVSWNYTYSLEKMPEDIAAIELRIMNCGVDIPKGTTADGVDIIHPFVESVRDLIRDSAANAAGYIDTNGPSHVSHHDPEGENASDMILIGPELNGIPFQDVLRELALLEGNMHPTVVLVGDVALSAPELTEARNMVTHRLDAVTDNSLKLLAKAERERKELLTLYAGSFLPQIDKLMNRLRPMVSDRAAPYETRLLRDVFSTENPNEMRQAPNPISEEKLGEFYVDVRTVYTSIGRILGIFMTLQANTFPLRANSAVHDVNNVLTPILAFADFLREDRIEPALMTEILELGSKIAKHGQTLRGTMHDVANLSERILEFQSSNIEALQGKNIVIIDDSPGNLWILSKWAKANGAAKVTIAASEDEVRAISDDIINADIVISDHHIESAFSGAHVHAIVRALNPNATYLLHTDDNRVIEDPAEFYPGLDENTYATAKFNTPHFREALDPKTDVETEA